MNGETELSGYSGAGLTLLRTTDGLVVRKKAATISGNSRLKLQVEKQRAYEAIDLPIKSPKIFNTGEDEDGHFFFDMEFLGGVDGHRFLESSSPAELRKFTGLLCEHFSYLRELPLIGDVSIHSSFYDACLSKLGEIQKCEVELGDQRAGAIMRQLQVIDELAISEEGFCHGDCTFENMLIDRDGQIYFVDFLDSIFEHPIQDVVKLYQDLHGGWFQLKGRRISGAVLSYIDTAISQPISDDFPMFRKASNVLQALNYCRILPYVSEGIEKNFVINRIDRFIK